MTALSAVRVLSLSVVLAGLIGCASTAPLVLQADTQSPPVLRGALAYEAYVGPYWHDRYT